MRKVTPSLIFAMYTTGKLDYVLRALLLVTAVATGESQLVRPAVSTWTANAFAARITEHSVCHKALEPTRGQPLVHQRSRLDLL